MCMHVAAPMCACVFENVDAGGDQKRVLHSLRFCCELSECGCWDSNSSPMQEHQGPFTAEPSPSPQLLSPICLSMNEVVPICYPG